MDIGYQQFYVENSTQNKISTLLAHKDKNITSSIYGLETSDPDYQWLRANEENGVVSYGGISPTDTLILKTIQYKYPGEVGDEQEYPTLSYAFQELEFSIQDTITIETMGVSETFESEWATYKGCYVYRFSEISWDPVYHWDHYVYIKPRIGVVAVETIQLTSDIPNDVVGQWILVNHRINK